METRANYVLIGVFTLAVIAGGFLFVLWFTGLARNTQHKTFEVVFNGSVSGLSRGSQVSFNGLRVGEVTSIDFLPAEPDRVAAMIEVNERTPVKTDTIARLESQGLTGVATLALIGGGNSARELGPGPLGEPAVIYAERSDFQNLLETVQRISAKADDVLTKANKLLDDNGPAIGDTLRNADEFSKALADNAAGVKTFLASVSDLGQKLGPLSDKLQVLSNDVDAVVKAVEPGQVREVIGNLDAFTGALARNGGNIDSVFGDAAALAKRLNGSADKLDSALNQVNDIAKSIDRTKIAGVIDNLSTLSATLAHNQGNIDGILSDAAVLAKRLGGTSQKLDTALDQVNDLVKSVDRSKIATIVNDVAGFAETIAHNQGNIDSLLANVSAFSATLAHNQANIDGILSDAAAFAKRLGGTSEKLDAALDQVNDLAKSVDRGKVATIVNDVAGFTETLAHNQGNIDSLLADAATLAKHLNGTSQKLDNALDQVADLGKAFDHAKIANAVDNVSSFTDTLKHNQGNVDRMLKDASELAAKLDNSADQIDGLMRSLQGVVGSPEAKGAISEVGDAARSVRRTADNLDQSIKDISGGLTRFSGSGLREYEALAVDGRRTVNDLDRLLRSLNSNPSQVIFGGKAALPEYHGQ
jgi:phospholipid/cholesterol/gamma-HCH transport system substrate-binding protein